LTEFIAKKEKMRGSVNKKAILILIVLLEFLSNRLAYGLDDYGGHLYLFQFVRNIGPSGFYGSDPKAMGMGNIHCSVLEDASAICWNPAGAVLLDGINATLVYKYTRNGAIKVRNDYEEIADSDYRFNHHHMVDGFMTLSTSPVTIGLSYTPVFIIPIDAKLLMAPQASQKGHLNCDAFTLTLARWLRKNIAIGINLSYIHTDGRLEIDYEEQEQTDELGNVIGRFCLKHRNSLSGNGFGYDFGLYFRPNRKLSLGLVAKRYGKVHWDESHSLSLIGYQSGSESIPDEFQGKADGYFIISNRYGAGGSFNLFKSLWFAGEVVYIKGSEARCVIEKEKTVFIDSSQADIYHDQRISYNWKDRTELHFGTKFNINEHVPLRFGFFSLPDYKESPFSTDAQYFFTLGTGFHKDLYQLDISYADSRILSPSDNSGYSLILSTSIKIR